MSDRDKIAEIIREARINASPLAQLGYPEADALLDYGVIVPPCKVGTHLWRVTTPYRKQPKVTEYIVKNFKTVGKKHNLQIEVQALNVPMTNWMYYIDFYATKEEAEKKLEEMRGNVAKG